jgi:O-antigen chain-terminating methyltransferase
MSGDFYRLFEERYYASREVIKALRRQYLPFAKLIANVYPGSATFDAGCGRGEWLELMGELELSPYGVDLDDGMLSACVELGLPVQKGDAISHIATLPDESQSIVSAFHVIEHISFAQLRTLVAEAFRVLKPGGLLFMETPNPENIVVATCNFYLDPTHQRPIPPSLLAFIVEYSGFTRVKTLRLQESKELVTQSNISLQAVFAGASPDYAVVAQKDASEDVLELTGGPFSADYGLSLDDLLGRWDSRFDRLECKAQQAESKALQAESKAQQAESKALQAESKAQQAESKALQAESKAQQAESKALRADALLTSTINKRSWWRTKPRQISVKAFDFLRNWSTQALKPAFYSSSTRTIRFISTHPQLKRSAMAVTQRYSRLEQKLRHYSSTLSNRLNQDSHQVIEETSLTPRARQILYSLKTMIEKTNKGAN